MAMLMYCCVVRLPLQRAVRERDLASILVITKVRSFIHHTTN